MAMVPRRRRAGLGAFNQAAWDDYQAQLAHGGYVGTPNGSIEDPNGGVIHLDANGLPDSYSPPASFAASATGTYSTDNVVERNSASTFYGWTEYEKDAFYRAAYNQTGIVTDMVRNAPKLADGSTDPAVVARSDAALLAFAQTNPKVAAAVAVIQGGGTFRGEQQSAFDAANAATVTQNDATLLADIKAHLASLIAAGAVFADTIPAGTLYQSKFLMGMLTTQQWIDDQWSLAHGGTATNAAAQAGKIPTGVTSSEAYAAAHPAPVSSAPTSGAGRLYGSGGGATASTPLTAGAAMDANASAPSQALAESGGGYTFGGGSGGALASVGGALSSPWVLGGIGLVAIALMGRKRGGH